MNHKIVIVNDGSTDGTEDICLSFKKKYEELITYVYQENKGLGGARNTGMKYVETPYMTFLDSDDWLHSRFVECFSRLIQNVDEWPDMVFTLPWVYDSTTKRVEEWRDKELYDRIFEGSSRIVTNTRRTPELYALEVNACRKIYRTDFLKRQQFAFPCKLKWEDVPGHFQLLHEANTCMALPEVGFFYRTNQGGQITAGGGASRLDMIPIFRQLLEIQGKYRFQELERAYVLRLIVDFSLWSVDATNQQYIHPLLDELHVLYQTLSEKDIAFYLSHVSTDRRRESGFIYCVRSEEYQKLSEYRIREYAIEKHAMTENAPKKNLIVGGVQCIMDHGIVYTLAYLPMRLLGKKQCH
jgi:glycosyltransferase involved in cell wall biosynthesis